MKDIGANNCRKNPVLAAGHPGGKAEAPDFECYSICWTAGASAFD